MGYHGPSADLLYSGVCMSMATVYLHMPDEGYPLAGSVAVLCTWGLDVIRNEAWPFYRTSSDVRLCWELEERKGPNAVGTVAGRG